MQEHRNIDRHWGRFVTLLVLLVALGVGLPFGYYSAFVEVYQIPDGEIGLVLKKRWFRSNLYSVLPAGEHKVGAIGSSSELYLVKASPIDQEFSARILGGYMAEKADGLAGGNWLSSKVKNYLVKPLHVLGSFRATLTEDSIKALAAVSEKKHGSFNPDLSPLLFEIVMSGLDETRHHFKDRIRYGREATKQIEGKMKELRVNDVEIVITSAEEVTLEDEGAGKIARSRLLSAPRQAVPLKKMDKFLLSSFIWGGGIATVICLVLLVIFIKCPEALEALGVLGEFFVDIEIDL